jgi:hypothetical protein
MAPPHEDMDVAQEDQDAAKKISGGSARRLIYYINVFKSIVCELI